MQEPPKWVPTFDDMITSALQALGLSPIIVGLVVLCFSLKSWKDGISDSVSIASRAYAAGQAGVNKVRSIGPTRGVLTLLISTVGLAAQGFTLLILYIAGNYLSIAFHMPSLSGTIAPKDELLRTKLYVFQSVWDQSGVLGFLQPDLYRALSLDAVSLTITILGLIGIMGAYASSHGGKASAWWSTLMALPFALWAPLALVIPALSYLLQETMNTTVSSGQFEYFVSGVVCFVITATCAVAAKASGPVKSSWSV